MAQLWIMRWVGSSHGQFEKALLLQELGQVACYSLIFSPYLFFGHMVYPCPFGWECKICFGTLPIFILFMCPISSDNSEYNLSVVYFSLCLRFPHFFCDPIWYNHLFFIWISFHMQCSVNILFPCPCFASTA